MDHLPVLDNYKHRQIEVPYLNYGLKYDFKEFHGFPERIVVDIDLLSHARRAFKLSIFLFNSQFRLANALMLEDSCDFDVVVARGLYYSLAPKDKVNFLTTILPDQNDIEECYRNNIAKLMFGNEYFRLTCALHLPNYFDLETSIYTWISTFF